jgi:predicted nucleotide-binding protein
MYFHVRITQASNDAHDETKLDLTEEQLRERFLGPYERGEPILINGKTIVSSDLGRIRISQSESDSRPLIAEVKQRDRNSSVFIAGGPSYEWQAAGLADDITDNLIQGPPGYRTHSQIAITSAETASSDKVFVVHGHDHVLKNDLEVFLHEVGLEPIVLHRQADEGLTLIEKIERHSDVNYAIVLLTPDDVGYTAAEYAKPQTKRKPEQRARQNVIFELGFFAGRLGRSRVCCLYKSGVVWPSDLSGFVYKEVKDSIEQIGHPLTRELRAAGLKLK